MGCHWYEHGHVDRNALVAGHTLDLVVAVGMDLVAVDTANLDSQLALVEYQA